MSLSQNQIDKIVQKTTNKINLSGGCDLIVKSIQTGNSSVAVSQLEQAIQLSISRCLFEVLKEIEK